MPRIYDVTVSHPTGFHSGTHRLTVRDNHGAKSCYISGEDFGCSRDYPTDDRAAIRTFLSEHGCSVVKLALLATYG